MGLQWPANYVYVDNPLIGTDPGFKVAQPIGIPNLSSPLPNTTEELILEQDFQMLRRYFTPTALNTAHPSAGMTPDFSAFILVSEGPRRDMSGGLCRWTRRYAKAVYQSDHALPLASPGSYNDAESYSYNFIGFQGIWAQAQVTGSPIGTVTSPGVTATGRPRFSRVVTSRVKKDFFLVDSGGPYTTPQSIPTVLGQTYVSSSILTTVFVDFIYDAFGPFSATVPDRTAYEALITGGTEIVAEDSRLTRWQGNIWLRETRYVVAQ